MFLTSPQLKLSLIFCNQKKNNNIICVWPEIVYVYRFLAMVREAKKTELKFALESGDIFSLVQYHIGVTRYKTASLIPARPYPSGYRIGAIPILVIGLV